MNGDFDSTKSISRVYKQMSYFVYDLLFQSDIKYLSKLRTDRQTFKILCNLLCEKGIWLALEMYLMRRCPQCFYI
ncbi:hypothetical protein WN944_009014 [Citrus x changshan-huyou]|uniref:Uncharacterized protein n=1 Tax=Citrus x changshan-huyou TaxID=2935761 RepID=A0AAP0MQZ6_9ROSI